MKNDRTSPEFWRSEDRAYAMQVEASRRQFREFCRRFRGDLSDVSLNYGAGYGNLTQLSARIMRADLLFRCPRPLVDPPANDGRIFTAKLARIETKLLQDFVQDADYYREMRRAALDFVLGYSAVVKIGVGRDADTDLRTMRKERARAAIENQNYALALRKPRLRKSDRHVTHIEEHARWLADARRSNLITDEDAQVMEDHIAEHARMIAFNRATEASKRERVTIERIHPENFSADPWASRPYDREWYKGRFIARVEDAKKNPNYKRSAVEAIQPCKVRRPEVVGAGQVLRESVTIETKDKHFLCHEVVDLVDQQVVVYAEGGTDPLEVRPWTLADIIPSGPYEEACLIEDPDECWGVNPPAVSMEHQTAMSEILGIAHETVRRSLPMQLINGRALDAETIEKIKSGDIAEVIIAMQAQPDADMGKATASVAPCEVPAQNFAVAREHGAMYDRQLGLGSPKLAGGDTSQSATESAINNSYANSLAEDSAAVWDDFQVRVLRKVERYHRAVLPRQQVYEIVGEEALDPDGWPEAGFPDRDIGADKNIGIVPASSRRNDSPILSKMLAEKVAMFQASPLAMMMPDILIELYQRMFNADGIYGINWDGALRAVVDQQLTDAASGGQAGAEPGDPNAQDAEGAGDPTRPSEMTEASTSGQQQGVMNVAGGRVGAGSNENDPMRMMR